VLTIVGNAELKKKDGTETRWFLNAEKTKKKYFFALAIRLNQHHSLFHVLRMTTLNIEVPYTINH